MLYRETPHLFPRGYHLNYKYITAPEELMKPARALVPCRSTLPSTAAAATPAFLLHRDSSEGHLHTNATPGSLHRRWDFTQAPLQCSSLSHPLQGEGSGDHPPQGDTRDLNGGTPCTVPPSLFHAVLSSVSETEAH